MTETERGLDSPDATLRRGAQHIEFQQVLVEIDLALAGLRQDEELIAAETRHGVCRANAGFQSMRGFDQQ